MILMNYLRGIPDYTGRLLFRMDTACGIVLGIVFFVVLTYAGLDQRVNASVAVAIIVLSAIEAGYGLYRKEQTVRSELESNVRVAARLGSYSANIPDPGPDKMSIKVEVFWEVWVKEDVSTDKLALNLIYTYDKPWWQFWKRTRFPQTGIPPNGHDTSHYRKRILASQYQPFKDNGTFEYVEDRATEGDPHWELELVLITGMPAGEHRIPVFIDYEEMRARRTNPPL